MDKTYKTLDGAYAKADKLGAVSFSAHFYGYAHRVKEAIDKTFTTPTARRLAHHNLVKLDKTLYALECVDKTYKWVAIGHFDHEGLFYPMSAPTSKKAVEDKQKPTPRKPAPAKALGIPKALKKDLDTLAGTGDNSAAHKVMCKHGFTRIKSPEYEAVWRGYWWTIR
jgi:hypothetical protein